MASQPTLQVYQTVRNLTIGRKSQNAETSLNRPPASYDVPAVKKVPSLGGVSGLILASVAGVVEALLLARLVARLLAARPDNPSVALLYAVTSPVVAPLRALDFDQPPFGAALEFSTLSMAILVPLATYLAWVLLARRRSAHIDEPS